MVHSKSFPLFSLYVLLSICVLTSGCSEQTNSSTGGGGGSEAKTPSVAYVTNGIASFWVIAEKGAMDGGKDFNANVNVLMPANGVEDQKRMCQDLLAQGIEGIAISPIDPENQGDLMAEISQHTKLITHDSDAPDSDRLCYIGMDNYSAGRLCGALVKEAMPEGGSVMIFVGRLGQANARLRRQGVIDELLDRDPDAARYDEPGNGEIKGDKYTILDTRTDGFDFGKAKAQAQDAIAKYDDLGCMVGLFAYNPPLMLDAVREAGKIGKIKIVAFDEDEATLQGIADEAIYGTVVQNPYKYGYESVRVLSALARGDESAIPESGFIDIPARQIRKDNIAEFRADLERLTAPSEAAEDTEETTEEPTGEKAEPAAAAQTNQLEEELVAATRASSYTVETVVDGVSLLEEFIRVGRGQTDFERKKADIQKYALRFALVGAIVSEKKVDRSALDASNRAFKIYRRLAGAEGIPAEQSEKVTSLQLKAEAALQKGA